MSPGLNSMNEAIKKLFIGPDTIFAGDVKLLNANIFDTTDISQVSDITNMVVDENTGTLSVTETVTTLSNATSPGYKMIVKIREAIASTYTALRDVCGYIMLAGLIFTGIKILLGSNIPSKNTRWLEALQDWLIGMALLIFSHIIMIGIFTLSDTLCDGLSGSLYGIGSINFTLITQCLLSWDSAEQIIYLIMLGYLIYLTVVFIVAYFKRLLWICVLIVIAPIVSVMYAFGHETKRIYTSWLREYIMSVLVQPFHLIIYYVLVSIPLNMVNSTGQFDLTSNGFEIIYALGAMSFIRPAEKYIRQLFGMDKGIANMASFDSGKQTIDAAKKAVEDFGKKLVGVVKTAAIVVASIYTGGAAGAAAGAAGGAGAAGAAGASSGAIGAGASGAAGSSAAGGLLSSGAAEGAAGGAEGLMGADGMGSLGEGAGNLLDFGTTGTMQEDPDFSFSPSSMGGAMEDFPEEDPLRLSRRESLEEQLADGQITENDLSQEDRELLGLEDKIDSTEEAEEKLSQASEELKDASEVLKDGMMSANNITITASNVNMQGNIENLETDEIKTVDGDGIGEESSEEDDEGTSKDDGIELEEASSNLRDLMSGFRDIGLGEQLRGLGNEAYKGINSVRDTFYVTPPPQDWKGRADRTDARIKEKDEKRKERNEREKSAWVKDKANIEFIIKEKGYMEAYRAQYPNKSEAFVRNLAEERAEKDLQKMSVYVPLGVRDVRQAYEYSKDAKRYGYSPEEAIRASAGFERFNKDSDNIAYINQIYETDVSLVSEAIPDAKDYYHNGYDNIGDMKWVDYMAAKLDKTPDYAMDIDRALRRKGGKIKYNGDNDELKDVIDQINQHYGK